MYNIKELAKLAGVTSRTLRYYDEIGLLVPADFTEGGYRLYGPAEVDRLQQILFYREMGLELKAIVKVLDDPTFDALVALKEHRRRLLNEEQRLRTLLQTVEKTIAAKEQQEKMKDKEKFAGFVEEMIADNEAKYGDEIRQKYGDDAVDQSNAAFRAMGAEGFAKYQALEGEITAVLKEAMAEGDVHSGLSDKLFALHKEWITAAWGNYNPAAHKGVGQMYAADPRFTEYYDSRSGAGAAEFLNQVIAAHIDD